MNDAKQCPWCGDSFTPEHGNDTYCCDDCKDDAKAERQKRKRDPVSRFFPILVRNHETLEALHRQGKHELSIEEIEAHGLDLSLTRYIKPPIEFKDNLCLDFGKFFLITDTNFQIFKILKHETFNATQIK